MRLAIALLCVLSLSGITACDDEGDHTRTVSSDVCASGTQWTGGDEESAQMNPGQDCVGCHAGRGPTLRLGGTVYASLDAATNCFGVQGALVRILDADGKAHELTTNPAGNFFFTSVSAITTPFTVEVVYDGKTRTKQVPQTSFACNSCHTAAGANGAPGRIAIAE